MDLLAHAVYGATACSRTGFTGGAKGAIGRRWFEDWTVWAAAVFGMLPDVVSMGWPFVLFLQAGMPGNFFRDLNEEDLACYRAMHSLVVALAACGILRLAWKPLFVPSLAWPLHVVMDSVTHGAGRFHTTIFYPLTDWGWTGIRWWQHPGFVLAYWLALPLVWLGLRAWRRLRNAG